jgi:hypothetical protein
MASTPLSLFSHYFFSSLQLPPPPPAAPRAPARRSAATVNRLARLSIQTSRSQDRGYTPARPETAKFQSGAQLVSCLGLSHSPSRASRFARVQPLKCSYAFLLPKRPTPAAQPSVPRYQISPKLGHKGKSAGARTSRGRERAEGNKSVIQEWNFPAEAAR